MFTHWLFFILFQQSINHHLVILINISHIVLIHQYLLLLLVIRLLLIFNIRLRVFKQVRSSIVHKVRIRKVLTRCSSILFELIIILLLKQWHPLLSDWLTDVVIRNSQEYLFNYEYMLLHDVVLMEYSQLTLSLLLWPFLLICSLPNSKQEIYYSMKNT